MGGVVACPFITPAALELDMYMRIATELPLKRLSVGGFDLIICYIEHEKGGAWKTVEYAMKQGKTVINLNNPSLGQLNL